MFIWCFVTVQLPESHHQTFPLNVNDGIQQNDVVASQVQQSVTRCRKRSANKNVHLSVVNLNDGAAEPAVTDGKRRRKAVGPKTCACCCD